MASAKRGTIGTTEAVDAARRWYAAALRREVERLRPRFEAGELRAWISGDGEHGAGRAPFFKLEDEMEHLCRDQLRAALVLVASPHARWAERGLESPRLVHIASSAAARDALALARELGYSRQRRGESWPYTGPADAGHIGKATGPSDEARS